MGFEREILGIFTQITLYFVLVRVYTDIVDFCERWCQMEWLSEFVRRFLVVLSSFWPLLVIAVVGALIQIIVYVRRRSAYSKAVENWDLVDAELMETRSVVESVFDDAGRKHYETYYEGKVRFDDGVRLILVSKKWHKMAGKAGGMQHRSIHRCDDIPVEVLVDPDDSSNMVVPSDFDTVLGSKGVIWQIGLAMTILGVIAFLVVFLMLVNFV